MNRIVFGIFAVCASFMLVESLTCNKCSFSLVGYCLNSGDVVCSPNSSVCYTGRTSFASLPDFVGFNSQSCMDNSTGCNTTTPGTLMGATYQSKVECCTTDKCNTVTLTGGAPSTKMTFTAAIGAALLASVSVSML